MDKYRHIKECIKEYIKVYGFIAPQYPYLYSIDINYYN